MNVYRFIAVEKAQYSVRRLCKALCVNRSSYYEWSAGRTWRGSADEADLAHIKAIHTRSRGVYGSPRIVS